MQAIRYSLLSLVCLASLGTTGFAQDEPQTEETYEALQGEMGGKGVLTLDWTDLLPEGEEDRLIQIYESFYTGMGGDQSSMLGGIQEGSPLDTMPQLGTFNTVEELDGQQVELPGFVVPLDFRGRAHSTFLIVPYFGACIHTPPPAPNQIVYAVSDPAQELGNIYYPLWFKGVLETSRQNTDLGNAAYTLRLESVRPYE